MQTGASTACLNSSAKATKWRSSMPRPRRTSPLLFSPTLSLSKQKTRTPYCQCRFCTLWSDTGWYIDRVSVKLIPADHPKLWHIYCVAMQMLLELRNWSLPVTAQLFMCFTLLCGESILELARKKQLLSPYFKTRNCYLFFWSSLCDKSSPQWWCK